MWHIFADTALMLSEEMVTTGAQNYHNPYDPMKTASLARQVGQILLLLLLLLLLLNKH